MCSQTRVVAEIRHNQLQKKDFVFSMTTRVLTVKEIIPYIRDCGYKGEALMEDYVYCDINGEHQVGAVGFFGEAHNSSTACIAVIENGNANEEDVLSYRLLGSPVVLACGGEFLQFWHFQEKQAVRKESIGFQKLDAFFGRYQEDFKPDRILRAKKMGRVNNEYQLGFVDLGLMEFIEEQEGVYLAGLVERIIKKLAGTQATLENWHFQAAFWLIGAKILQDKGVEGFRRMDIENIDSLMDKVRRHYHAQNQMMIPRGKIKHIQKAAREIVKPVSSFSHMTIDSLAYVYENTLVSKATRKALGAHATPSWLVNYIVWQLADWIEAIPEDERFVMEPACGHSPFLTASARLLSFLYKGSDRHVYLKNHLTGIELDPFAAEIARLSLTLADLPNKDGWRIINDDIYNKDVMKEAAKRATILFCNPPFENFSTKEKKEYDGIETGNKAAEVLAQTLQYMKEDSVFGVILPQGFLHKKNLAGLRKSILDNFEIRTICNLPDNVFAKAGHLSTVLLGRKRPSKKNISYIRISKFGLDNFKTKYQAKEEAVTKQDLYKSENCSFRVPELKEIWEYCKKLPVFQKYVTIGRGIEYKSGLKKDSKISPVEKQGFKQGFYDYSDNPCIESLPKLVWLNTLAEDINTFGSGTNTSPKIFLNRIRIGRSPWRLRGHLDSNGMASGKAFLSVIPKKDISLYVFWALVNSPFVNAYLADHCDRDNNEGVLSNMPVPFAGQDLSRLEKLVEEYFELSQKQKPFMLDSGDKDKEEKKSCLLKIDAEVLRLYDLPPRLEKQLLDFFAGHQRKGVDFDFDRYYPENFGSYIPLRMFISEEFQNSTVENVGKWVEETRNGKVVKAWGNAVKAFGDDK